MAGARPIAGVTGDATFGDAAAAALEARTRDVFEHAAGLASARDIDRIHDMRVATRRLRVALEVFAACFARKPHRELLKQVKQLAAALGERRDPDVAIESLRRLEGAFHAADRAGLRSLVAVVEDERAVGDERLARALAEVVESRLEERLLALAKEART